MDNEIKELVDFLLGGKFWAYNDSYDQPPQWIITLAENLHYAGFRREKNKEKS